MRRALALISVAATALVGAPSASSQGAAPAAAPARRAVAPSKAAAGSPARTSRPAASASSRDGMAVLEVRLNEAADRVSVPQLLPMLGHASGARAYRLPGYGIVVILAPRALPGSDVLKMVRPRHRGQRESPWPGPAGVEGKDELEAIEQQVILLQHESEEARRAAEEAQRRIVETVRVRLASPGEAPGEMTVEVAPPAAPGTPTAAAAGAPPAAPAPAVVPEPPPPWKYWFHVEGPLDTRSPDTVVTDVRGALVDALAEHAGSVASGLGPDESVTVAVDFEDAGRLAGRHRPARTLVVRARVKDIRARAAGAIAADELRRRLDVLEY
jgi:hypothetical protein